MAVKGGRDQWVKAIPPLQQWVLIRDQIRFDIGLLNDRVNALLAAEAFDDRLIAAMGNRHPVGTHVLTHSVPMLALLSLFLAALAWRGVDATEKIVLDWT